VADDTEAHWVKQRSPNRDREFLDVAAPRIEVRHGVSLNILNAKFRTVFLADHT